MMSTPNEDFNPPLTWEGAPATDAVGQRQVSVCPRGDRVVLMAPPGGIAELDPDEARTLADRLYEQADEPQPSTTVVPFRRKTGPSRPRTGSGT